MLRTLSVLSPEDLLILWKDGSRAMHAGVDEDYFA